VGIRLVDGIVANVRILVPVLRKSSGVAGANGVRRGESSDSRGVVALSPFPRPFPPYSSGIK
jgi:hypothetical protein